MSLFEPARGAFGDFDPRYVEAVPLPALVIDDATQSIVCANALAMQLYRLSPGRLASLRIDDFSFQDGCRAQHKTTMKVPIDVDVFSREVLVSGRAARLVVVRDVTAEVEAWKRLQASEGRYRHLFESSHELVQSVDASGRFTYANAAWLRTLGYTAENVPCLTVADVVAPESLEQYLEALARAVSGERFDHLQTAFRTRDGRTVLAEGSVASFSTHGGSGIEILGLFRDVTARRRAEQSLRDAETRLESFVENATDIVYGIDLTGRFTFVNAVAARITGFDRSQLVGMKYLDLIRRDYHAAARELYARHYRERLANTYFEFPIVTASGAELWIGQNVQAIYEHGQITGFQGFARDITEQKRIHDQIALSSDAAAAAARTRVSLTAELEQRLGRTKAAVEELVNAGERERSAAAKVALQEATSLREMMSDVLDFCRGSAGPAGDDGEESETDAGQV